MSVSPPTSLRIIQVSDCHLSEDRDRPYRGLNPDRSLTALLPALKRWQPDLVLLTGDVSDDASADSYRRVSAALSSLDSPVLGLPGNHDEPGVMKSFFPLGPWQSPLLHVMKGWGLILLDSTAPGEIGGVLSQRHLDDLARGLQDCGAQHLLLALHHQPVPVGSPWIDRYALADPAGLWSVLDTEPRLRGVTWGHVHQDFVGQRDGVGLFGAPSTVANSVPAREKFTLDEEGPACRWLLLHCCGRIETGLLRAPRTRE